MKNNLNLDDAVELVTTLYQGSGSLNPSVSSLLEDLKVAGFEWDTALQAVYAVEMRKSLERKR